MDPAWSSDKTGQHVGPRSLTTCAASQAAASAAARFVAQAFSIRRRHRVSSQGLGSQPAAGVG